MNDVCKGLESKVLGLLKKQIKQLYESINNFLEHALVTLHKQPNNVDELAESKNVVNEVSQHKNKYNSMMRDADNKYKLLISSMSENDASINVNMDALKEQWYTFENSLLTFNDILIAQKENLKSQHLDKISKFRNDVAAFRSRWQALKPKHLEQVKLKL